MIYTKEVEEMCTVARGASHGCAPIPEEGKWVYSREIKDISGKTLLEGLNTDLVCDAINTAMRELFLQIVYGRSQSAFSEGGLSVGAGLEDLGKGLRSMVGTSYSTKLKGPRYLELTEGYINRIALDDNNEIIGYEFINLGRMMDMIKSGKDANEALKEATGTYGRFDSATKYIDPRKE